jgi:hypothetical protein
MRTYVSSFPSALVLTLLVSCKTQSENPNHCQNQDGNAWCAEKYPDGSLPFCGIGACPGIDAIDGCLAERPADDACYSPCGDDQTFEDDPSCDGVAETGTDATTLTTSMSDTTPTTSGDPTTMSSMSMSGTDTDDTDATTEPTTETGPTGCVGSEECTDPGNPVCVDEVCAPCTEAGDGDAACAEKDSEAPACAASGECVECTDGNPAACDGTTPVCDAGSSSCVACTYHEQCPESACRIGTGECFSNACVVEVGGDKEDPETIGEAIGDGCVLLLHEGAGYTENIVLGSGDVVAILAHETATFPVINGAVGNDPTVQVSNMAELYLQGVTISGNTGVGVQASGAGFWLDRTQVIANTGGGIELASNASGIVRNSIVSGNGNEAPTSRGFNVTDSTLDLLYTTVARNDAGTEDSLVCNGGSTVTVRNSIVVGRHSPSVGCVPLTATFSVFDEVIPGMGNENVAMIDNGWFEDVFTFDFHLLPAGTAAFGGVAEWTTVDPLVDIDGDLRPNVGGTADVAGADVPL